MKKYFISAVAACILACSLFACSSAEPASEEVSQENATSVSDTPAADNQAQESENESVASTVANTIAADEEALVSTYESAFEQYEYTDEQTGLSVTYNLFLPASYDENASYPMVVFIADSSCTGSDASASLTQGLGALVWAAEEWQASHECIVCVPTYPETILDDHGSYTTTEYVELTKRLIESVSSEYAVDTDMIIGTGQSMGCMTTLILASKYPDLYHACMFVDGQWDISTLSGLENEKFIYFAAEDDSNAYAGMTEVMQMFDEDGISYSYVQWDGTWEPDQLSASAEELYSAGAQANFVSWKTGTIDASESNMGMGGGSAGYHMASFDYAYNCITAMEWLFT